MVKRILLGACCAARVAGGRRGGQHLRHGRSSWTWRPAPPLNIDEKAVADKLAAADHVPQTCPAWTTRPLNAGEFRKLHAFLLQQRFPRVHATLQREWSTT
jgi:hypothetical protein